MSGHVGEINLPGFAQLASSVVQGLGFLEGQACLEGRSPWVGLDTLSRNMQLPLKQLEEISF